MITRIARMASSSWIKFICLLAIPFLPPIGLGFCLFPIKTRKLVLWVLIWLNFYVQQIINRFDWLFAPSFIFLVLSIFCLLKWERKRKSFDEKSASWHYLLKPSRASMTCKQVPLALAKQTELAWRPQVNNCLSLSLVRIRQTSNWTRARQSIIITRRFRATTNRRRHLHLS